MSNRRRLPNRRQGTTFEIQLAGLAYTVTFARFGDGALAELFVRGSKAGSQSDSNARDSAIAASLALQYGCPLEVLQRAVLRDPGGAPSTPLGMAIDAIVEREP